MFLTWISIVKLQIRQHKHKNIYMIFFSQYNCVVDYNNDDYCFMLYVLATWQNTQPEQYFQICKFICFKIIINYVKYKTTA